jgi:mannosyltransferase OCH1-like enzyme
MVLYTYGGVYLDLDIGCKSPITNLLHKYDLILAKSVNFSDTITNAFIACTPKNPFILFCIQNLMREKDSYNSFGKHLHVMNSTGPLFFTHMLSIYPPINNMLILNEKQYVFDCTVCNADKCKGGKYFYEVKGDSWHELDSAVLNDISCTLNVKKHKVSYVMIIGLIIFCICSILVFKYKNIIVRKQSYF